MAQAPLMPGLGHPPKKKSSSGNGPKPQLPPPAPPNYAAIYRGLGVPVPPAPPTPSGYGHNLLENLTEIWASDKPVTVKPPVPVEPPVFKSTIHSADCCIICGCKYNDPDCAIFMRGAPQRMAHGYTGACAYTENRNELAAAFKAGQASARATPPSMLSPYHWDSSKKDLNEAWEAGYRRERIALTGRQF